MNKGYKIIMMTKDEIRIDSDELPKVLKAITTGSPAILKQAIFNPSSYSHIIEDYSRNSFIKVMDKFGHYTGETEPYFELLPDIFEDIKELAELKRLK